MTTDNSVCWFKRRRMSVLCFLSSVEGYDCHCKGIKKQPVQAASGTPTHKASNSLNSLWRDDETLLWTAGKASWLLSSSQEGCCDNFQQKVILLHRTTMSWTLQLLAQQPWFRAYTPHPPQQKIFCDKAVCHSVCLFILYALSHYISIERNTK